MTKQRYKSRTFPKQEMLDILYEENDQAEIVSDEIVDQRRWSTVHELVFCLHGVFYSASYSVGSTEQQDESPWEWEDEVECLIVEPVEVKTIEYHPVKED